jgi:hypothetical protein
MRVARREVRNADTPIVRCWAQGSIGFQPVLTSLCCTPDRQDACATMLTPVVRCRGSGTIMSAAGLHLWLHP